MDNLKHWESVVEENKVNALDDEARSGLLLSALFRNKKGEMIDGR